MNRKQIILPLIAVCAAVFIISAVKLIEIESSYIVGNSVYESLAGSSVSQTLDTADGKTVITADFSALRELNDDTVAWIYIADTPINYPVMQTDNNSYYLRRLFDGTWNNCGSIFMDYRNDAALNDRNTVIYGHRMKNGSMFDELFRYNDQLFYEAHPTVLLMTPDGDLTVELFSAFIADVSQDAWKLEFSDDEEYARWLKWAKGSSFIETGICPEVSDRVVTFSTCTNESDDERFVVMGILRKGADM